MRLRWRFVSVWLALILAASAFGAPAAPAQAQAPAQALAQVRLGKAQAQNFAFLPADVGLEAGIFKRNGIDLAIANFGGDARLVQAITADAIDIALGGGPTLAFAVKGAPMLAIAALADRPSTIMLVVA